MSRYVACRHTQSTGYEQAPPFVHTFISARSHIYMLPSRKLCEFQACVCIQFFFSTIKVSEQQSSPIVCLKVVEESEVITIARALKANNHTLVYVYVHHHHQYTVFPYTRINIYIYMFVSLALQPTVVVFFTAH